MAATMANTLVMGGGSRPAPSQSLTPPGKCRAPGDQGRPGPKERRFPSLSHLERRRSSRDAMLCEPSHDGFRPDLTGFHRRMNVIPHPIEVRDESAAVERDARRATRTDGVEEGRPRAFPERRKDPDTGTASEPTDESLNRFGAVFGVRDLELVRTE